MKQKLSFILAICLVIFALSGCTAEPAANTVSSVSGEPNSLSSLAASSEEELIPIQECTTLGGEGGSTGKGVSDYFRADQLNLPETLPIFENRYYDWSLREYTMDELNEQNAKEDLEKYLNHLYEITNRERPENGFTFSSSEEDEIATDGKDYYYAFSNEFIEKIYRRIGFMVILSSLEENPGLHDAVKEGKLEEILNDPFIQSAVWFAGYDEPDIVEITPETLKENRPTCETLYLISEKAKLNSNTEEKLYQEDLSGIEIGFTSDTVRIQINFRNPAVLATANVVPFADALRYAQEKYPDYGITAETCEIHYFPYIQRGKLIPAYELIPTQGDFYGNIYISATDYDLENAAS